jgi:Uma2 family endonuclease
MAGRKFTPDDFMYPSSYDIPEAESDLHRKVVTDLIARLEARYSADPNVYVSGLTRVYCEEWNPYDVLVPDCFVVFGVPKRGRTMYLGWQEARMPNVVIEVTSKYTEQEDKYTKVRRYERDWQVEEYFVFDPGQEYLNPPLQGYRLVRGKFTSLKPSSGSLTSRVFGITLTADGTRLVLRDTTTGEELLTATEQRAATEAEVARLKAELDALRRKPTK